MKLSVLAQKTGANIPSQELEIEAVVQNPKDATACSMFVCIRGARFNGHDFAPKAYENGCRIFVASEPIKLPKDATVFSVTDTREALAKLSSALNGNPSKEIKLIGITGTKGKTTVAMLLTQVLNQSGISCGYIGTNGISYNNRLLPSQNTTPDPITLQSTLRSMANDGVKAVILEVSSQAIYQSRVIGCEFDACVFTNLSSDHVGPNEHPTFAHYTECKHRLFTDFGCKLMVANLDDPYATLMQSNTSAERTVTYSQINEHADYVAKNVLPTLGKHGYGVSFSLHNEKDDLCCTLPMLGKFNVGNALAAVAVAKECFAIPANKTLKILERASVDGRTETVRLASGACAVIDYAHNGTSLRQLLSALREYKPRRLICLFGSVGERSFLRRRELGDAAAQLCDLAILTSDNPGHEDPMAIIREIAASFEGTNTPYLAIPDRFDAIKEALCLAKQEDILVLAGKGHEAYQLIGDEKIPFSERDILTKFESNERSD